MANAHTYVGNDVEFVAAKLTLDFLSSVKLVFKVTREFCRIGKFFQILLIKNTCIGTQSVRQ
jgi:hypothetical protein